MNANGRNDFIALGIDHADVVGIGVGHINFILGRIGGDSGWTFTDMNGGRYP